ncbi:hypothetical protein [Actinomadura litoris]|uniref:hypothetical protein n=1 Tax=Actinomadura litoris TaxID=2678616 RepID=UPI001FA7057C|nr:hypothetical protein [Actinomadura litoris]
MSAALAQVPWQTLLASGLVAALLATIVLLVQSIIKGNLVPRQHLLDVQAERDKWEAAWRLQQETLTEIDGRLDANTEALKLMQHLIDSLATKGPAR